MESYCNTIQILWNHNAQLFRYHGIILQNYSDLWNTHTNYFDLAAAKGGIAAGRFLMESWCKTIQITWSHGAKPFRSLESTYNLLAGSRCHNWSGREATLNELKSILWNHIATLSTFIE